MFSRLYYLVRLHKSHRIARRYFVTNGFDGVLAMLGLLIGFRISEPASLTIMLNACLGGAVALFMSGLTSAYISESAEKRHELNELEKSMVTSMEDTTHGDAAQLVPVVIALVNGLSPFLFALILLLPLFLAQRQINLVFPALDVALFTALLLAFLLGVFLGRVSGQFWLWTGLRALLIALVTSVIIFLIHRLI